MKTLKTNLGNLLGGVIMTAPIKSGATTQQVKIETLAKASLGDAIQQAWKALNVMIVDFYMSQKGTATMEDVKLKFKDQIAYLNANIKASDITYVLDGNYIRAFYKNQRIGQLSTQNSKLLPNNKGVGFLIWSVLGHISCNGKTSVCSSFCYNNSKSFGANKELKTDCLILSLLDIFPAVMGEMIQLSPHQKSFVRIHEDGDFYDMTYFSKWLEVAENNKNFEFEAYTKEPELLDKVEKINAEKENFLLRFSLMEDTKPEIVEFVRENNLPNYTVLGMSKKDKSAKELFEHIRPENRCVGSCQFCKKCYTKSSITVVTTIH